MQKKTNQKQPHQKAKRVPLLETSFVKRLASFLYNFVCLPPKSLSFVKRSWVLKFMTKVLYIEFSFAFWMFFDNNKNKNTKKHLDSVKELCFLSLLEGIQVFLSMLVI